MKSAFPNIITIGTFDSRRNYPSEKKTEPRMKWTPKFRQN